MTPTPTPLGSLAALASSVWSIDTWEILAVVILFGALGGWAHRLGAPKDDSTRLLAYVVLGGVAALGALLVVPPGEPLKLVAFSVVAGYAGKAVMSALQARVEAAVAKAETVTAKAAGLTAADTGLEAVERGEKLAGKVAGRKSSGAVEFANSEKIAQADVSEDLAKLKELKGRLDALSQILS